MLIVHMQGLLSLPDGLTATIGGAGQRELTTQLPLAYRAPALDLRILDHIWTICIALQH